MTERSLGFDTRKVRAGYDPAEHNYAISPPIYQTTAYDFKDVEYAQKLFAFEVAGNLYTRVGNPTVAVFEQRMAELDGAAGAIALGSGMAAISYTLLNLAEDGGRILSSPYLYGGSIDSFKKLYPKFGVHIDYAEHIHDPEKLDKEIRPDTKTIFIESISNPSASLLDLRAIADVAHRHGIPLVVDNTVATPYLLRPIEHGADLVVYSATKGLSGHGNIIAGLVLESGAFDWGTEKFPHFAEKHYTLRDHATGEYRSYLEVFPDAPFTTRIRFHYLNYFGAALGPFDAYLALIGIETLSERIAKQVSTAGKIAAWLDSRKDYVEWVRHPSLPDSPYHALAEKYFPNGAGGILAFGFKGDEAQRERFLNAVELLNYHVNIGDARTLIVDSPNNTHGELEPSEKDRADVPENLIRISAGLEDPQDLIDDLNRAFAASEDSGGPRDKS
ncbi:MAG: aminotransferase class I/II-fold pyridoxal phosphate-dependent enzyme [Clostridiales Family XIII bacterium]|jgi:O-acetylhomoserine (thiol)-lyase|nr:aminotransferase class I/II-fold pyridoxal phosphate-dependent enzyme [Clostridiales Family XIII bacterium]